MATALDHCVAHIRAHSNAAVLDVDGSTETDDVRVVVLMPSYEWGGEGCLGADIGYGYLHRLPAKCCTTLGRSSGKETAMACRGQVGLHGRFTVGNAACSLAEGGCVAANSPFGANDVSAVSNGAAQDLQTGGAGVHSRRGKASHA